MLEITRILARQLRVVFGRVLGRISKYRDEPMVLFNAGHDGLSIRTATDQAAVEYHQMGSNEPVSFAIPLSMLVDLEGRKPDPVRFEVNKDNQVTVNWGDHRIPQRRTFQPPKKFNDVPTRPETTATNGPGLLKALANAAHATDKDSIRYALNCIQLHGGDGHVAATDGRQLFVQLGFQFPWQDEVLLPANAIFGCPELPADQSVDIGKIGNMVVLSVGNWTIWLNVLVEGRFPTIKSIIGNPDDAKGRMHLAPADSEFLAHAIDRLPGNDDQDRPVTFDLNGQVAILAKGVEQPQPTELVLANSIYTGDPLRIVANRTFLARAVELGFSEFLFTDPLSIIRARDQNRIYLWMPMDPEIAIKRTDDVIRITSDQQPAGSTVSQPTSKPHTRRFSMPAANKTSTTDGHANGNGNGAATASHDDAHGSAIEKAMALRVSLRDALDKTHDLIGALKRQKKQSRLVASTLASLKQLQAAG